MSQILILDAAFPPSPNQWVADMDAIGAQGGAIYVYGGFTNYTAAHVQTAQASGKHVFPIIVTGNTPPPPPLYAAAAPYGLTNGLIVYDVETNSEPGPVWVQQAVDKSNQAGWNAGVYCGQDLRGSYSAGWFWLSQWPYAAGIWQPVPNLVAGASAWQYAHDVAINGSQYDVSIFDDSLFGGTSTVEDFLMALTQDQQNEVFNWVEFTKNVLDTGSDPNVEQGGAWIAQQFAQVLNKIGTPATVDPTAVATALAQDQAFLNALAAQIAHELGMRLLGQ